MLKRNWQLLLFCVVHVLILFVLFNSSIYSSNTSLRHDILVYFDYSTMIVSGNLPYQQFTVEYPPMALVFFTLPRMVASSFSAYYYTFLVEILIFDLLGLFLLFKLSQRVGLHPAITLAIYTVLVVGIGPILIHRYDLIPAVMVLASLYAFSRQKYKLAWIILAIGVMTKLYPVVLAPIYLIYQFSHRRYREAGWGGVAFFITTVVMAVPGILLSPGGFWESYSLQMQRGLHVESTYSSLLLFAQTLGLTEVSVQDIGTIPISVDVVSSLASILAKTALVVMVLSLALIYRLFYRRNKRDIGLMLPDSWHDMVNLINYSCLVILVFMLTNKVFSPQFLIWLCPIVPLIICRWRHAPWLILTLVGILTYCLFPLYYSDLMQGYAWATCFLLARNILLVVLACLLITWKRPATAYQPQLTSESVFKPYVVAVLLVVVTASIICTQFVLNADFISSKTTYEIQGDNTPASRNDRVVSDFSLAIPLFNRLSPANIPFPLNVLSDYSLH